MFSEHFKVRFYETDGLAHVSNTVVAGWFECGREPIFKMFTPDLDLQNWPLILASYKIDFHLQIYYGKSVEVCTYVSRVGNSSFDTYQEIWQQDQKVASGTTTLVRFDFESNKSVPIDGAIKSQLEEHLYPQQEA
ncbi:thioesterase family protein [Aliiglaciecola sp. 2_MG-2023]|uniref:acyl-CoA thioesterase n=1 Tax=unclassified Aliiglaciecola TaxID=2593648 RepID=UPI0026E22C82|nr:MULTISPECIES: thioesterase family protein [unclassified Aliiglaciecola]MDO6712659.1 thioesterase family protein [Aliiglaciecola sp. 2_MG-2023]MDO6754398.1 thioesterase family protein [Aliiglaciecola sp. 1_MG-2023]